jgi:hypothetical protein
LTFSGKLNSASAEAAAFVPVPTVAPMSFGRFGAASPGLATVAFYGPATLAVPATIKVNCLNDSNDDLVIRQWRITAIQVETLTHQ